MNKFASSVTYNLNYRPFKPGNLPFRLGTLPAARFQAAVNEFSSSRQCNPQFGYLGALAAISIASQNLLDVRTPDGHTFPCSLMLIGCGGPVSGKSAAAKYFLEAIEKYEKENADRLPGGGILYKNTTGAALFAGLAELPTGGLVSSEGSEVLFGIVRKHAADLNSLWSGESIRIRRRTTNSFVVHSGRITVLSLVHQGRLQKLLLESGDMLADMGLLSRLITFNSVPTPFASIQEAAPEPHREKFGKRILELLDLNLAAARDRDYNRKVLGFDPVASQTWLRYSAQLKADGRRGERFELAPEYAARMPENVARIAALLHTFECNDGEICESTLYSAIALCEEASTYYMSTFIPQISDEREAAELDDWLTYKFRQAMPVPIRSISRVTLRRYAQNRMRDYAVLDPLIEILVARGSVSVFKVNGSLKLDLMPGDGPLHFHVSPKRGRNSV